MKSGNARKVVIEGHTDERGGREYNLALGQKRAEAVRRSLACWACPMVDRKQSALARKLAVQGLAKRSMRRIAALNCPTVDERPCTLCA